jgi:hypothetical protein
MGDNNPGPSTTGNPPTMQDLINSLAQSTITSVETQGRLEQAFIAFLQHQETEATRRNDRPKGSGPKPKEPKSYDGDRSDGKLDDHIRDLKNWVNFWAVRHSWQDEGEMIDQAATYLTGKMARIFSHRRAEIHTFPEYIEWLQSMFKDRNEQSKLRDEWQALVQGSNSVHEYVSDLEYLASRITPAKGLEEKKEHFRAGLNATIQIRIAEHPEWDSLPFHQFVAFADRMEQIEALQQDVKRRTQGHPSGRLMAISETAPRRGGYKLQQAAKRPRKGTEQWQTYCKERDACYNCGESGHQSRNCKQPSDLPRVRARSSVPPPNHRRFFSKPGKVRT